MRNVCLIPVAAVMLACTPDAPRPADSVTVVRTPDSVAAPDSTPAVSNWDGAAGPVLLVAGERPDQAIVVSYEIDGFIEPGSLDVSELDGSAATLLSRAGGSSTVILGGEAPGVASSCNNWPVLSVAGEAPRWRVGFLDSAVQPLATDSVQGLAGRDSSALVAQVARLASGLEAVRGGDLAPSFHGLPFVVTDVRRFTHDSTSVMVAHVVRRVNQEANPLEEHTLLIAERRQPDGAWTVVRSERSAGREESVARIDFLAAARLNDDPMLVFSRDSSGTVRYVVQWRGRGGWSRRWESALSRC
jgi:hypothetical protein